jgi:hypothetical protein
VSSNAIENGVVDELHSFHAPSLMFTTATATATATATKNETARVIPRELDSKIHIKT